MEIFSYLLPIRLLAICGRKSASLMLFLLTGFLLVSIMFISQGITKVLDITQNHYLLKSSASVKFAVFLKFVASLKFTVSLKFAISVNWAKFMKFDWQIMKKLFCYWLYLPVFSVRRRTWYLLCIRPNCIQLLFEIQLLGRLLHCRMLARLSVRTSWIFWLAFTFI